MSLATDHNLPSLDTLSPTFQQDAPDLIAALHAEGRWIATTPLGFAVLEAEAVRELAGEPRLRTFGHWLLEMQGITSGRLYESVGEAILFKEGPDHTRLRGLVSRAFNSRAVERLRPTMRSHLAELVDRVHPDGRCEFMSAIADSYPVAVICDLVGAPQSDRPRFSAWAASIFKQFGLTVAEDLDEIETAIAEIDAYTLNLLEHRRARPGNDLLSELLVAEEEGDRLSYDELVMLVGALLLGGTDTTRNQLGLAVMCFAQHPDQWEALGADPGLAERAVEEVLRYVPTAQGMLRVVVEDFDYRDVVFPAGSLVNLFTWAANLQPDKVAYPLVFDIHADRGKWRPHTFGAGPHFCLGAILARAELAEALRVLSQRMPRLELDGEVAMKPSFGLQGPMRLPIRFTPR